MHPATVAFLCGTTGLMALLAATAYWSERWLALNRLFLRHIPKEMSGSQELRPSDVQFYAICGIVLIGLADFSLVIYELFIR